MELALHREGSANTIAVAEGAREELRNLQAELPDDMQLTLLTDQSVYIDEAGGWGVDTNRAREAILSPVL